MVLEYFFCSFIFFTRPPPIHPYFCPSILVFTRPNDGWTALYIKLRVDRSMDKVIAAAHIIMASCCAVVTRYKHVSHLHLCPFAVLWGAANWGMHKGLQRWLWRWQWCHMLRQSTDTTDADATVVATTMATTVVTTTDFPRRWHAVVKHEQQRGKPQQHPQPQQSTSTYLW